MTGPERKYPSKYALRSLAATSPACFQDVTGITQLPFSGWPQCRSRPWN